MTHTSRMTIYTAGTAALNAVEHPDVNGIKSILHGGSAAETFAIRSTLNQCGRADGMVFPSLELGTFAAAGGTREIPWHIGQHVFGSIMRVVLTVAKAHLNSRRDLLFGEVYDEDSNLNDAACNQATMAPRFCSGGDRQYFLLAYIVLPALWRHHEHEPGPRVAPDGHYVRARAFRVTRSMSGSSAAGTISSTPWTPPGWFPAGSRHFAHEPGDRRQRGA